MMQILSPLHMVFTIKHEEYLSISTEYYDKSYIQQCSCCKKFLISSKTPFLSVQLERCLKSRVALLSISATVIRLLFKGTFMPYEQGQRDPIFDTVVNRSYLKYGTRFSVSCLNPTRSFTAYYSSNVWRLKPMRISSTFN